MSSCCEYNLHCFPRGKAYQQRVETRDGTPPCVLLTSKSETISRKKKYAAERCGPPPSVCRGEHDRHLQHRSTALTSLRTGVARVDAPRWPQHRRWRKRFLACFRTASQAHAGNTSADTVKPLECDGYTYNIVTTCHK